jgi:O-antigen/teichoic acid export membrane protein
MKNFLIQFQGDSLKAQLLKSFTGSSGVKILNMFLTLVSGILLARLLGPDDYGMYVFILSIITLLGLPTQGGLPILVMRETSRYYHNLEWSKLSGLIQVANKFVILVSLFTVLIAAVALFIIESELKSSGFLWALLLLPLIAFGNIRGATLRGLREVVLGSLPEQVIRPLAVVLLLILSITLEIQVTLEISLQFTLIGAFLAFLFGAITLVKYYPEQSRIATSSTETKLWLRSIVPLTIFSSLNIVNNQIGVIFLGFTGLEEDISYFRVAFQGALLVAFGLMVADQVVAPHVIRFSNEKNKLILQRMIKNAAQGMTAISFFLVAIYYFSGKYFIEVLFGVEYLPAYMPLFVLSIGQLIRVATGSSGIVLNMLGYEKEVVKGALIGLLINLLLCLILVPKYGAIGAAVATSVSMIVWNCYQTVKLYQLTKLNSSIFNFKA